MITKQVTVWRGSHTNGIRVTVRSHCRYSRDDMVTLQVYSDSPVTLPHCRYSCDSTVTLQVSTWRYGHTAGLHVTRRSHCRNTVTDQSHCWYPRDSMVTLQVFTWQDGHTAGIQWQTSHTVGIHVTVWSHCRYSHDRMVTLQVNSDSPVTL